MELSCSRNERTTRKQRKKEKGEKSKRKERERERRKCFARNNKKIRQPTDRGETVAAAPAQRVLSEQDKDNAVF